MTSSIFFVLFFLLQRVHFPFTRQQCCLPYLNLNIVILNIDVLSLSAKVTAQNTQAIILVINLRKEHPWE